MEVGNNGKGCSAKSVAGAVYDKEGVGVFSKRVVRVVGSY